MESLSKASHAISPFDIPCRGKFLYGLLRDSAPALDDQDYGRRKSICCNEGAIRSGSA